MSIKTFHLIGHFKSLFRRANNNNEIKALHDCFFVHLTSRGKIIYYVKQHKSLYPSTEEWFSWLYYEKSENSFMAYINWLLETMNKIPFFTHHV